MTVAAQQEQQRADMELEALERARGTWSGPGGGGDSGGEGGGGGGF